MIISQVRPDSDKSDLLDVLHRAGRHIRVLLPHTVYMFECGMTPILVIISIEIIIIMIIMIIVMIITTFHIIAILNNINCFIIIVIIRSNVNNLLNSYLQVGVRREGTMALRNCFKRRDEKPMQMEILKNELDDLEEEDEDESEDEERG